ncbi:hypothetical protein LTS18_012787, partial [Coniosporium uncinatum]
MITGSCLWGSIRISYTGAPNIHGLSSRCPPNMLKSFCATAPKNDQLTAKGGDSKHSATATTTAKGACPSSKRQKELFKVEAGGESHIWTKGGFNALLAYTAAQRSSARTVSPQGTDLVRIRAGVLDDQSLVDEMPLQMEAYVERRPKWMRAIKAAVQLRSLVVV